MHVSQLLLLCDDHRYASVSTARGIYLSQGDGGDGGHRLGRARPWIDRLVLSLSVKVDMLGLWLHGKLDLLRSASELEKRV